MLADPRTAPSRPDLTFLRRRTARGPAAAPPPPSPPPPPPPPASSNSAGVDYVHHGSASAPAARSQLLDLSAPGPETSGLLDLSEPDVPAAVPTADVSPRPPEFEVVRVSADSPRVLRPTDPTVTLTRLQSGVGTLTIEAACSPAVGDLRLGCAWELSGGTSSVVQVSSGVGSAPVGSKRPVIVGDRAQFERLRIDLRQARKLNRLVVYAFSESGGQLNWGGTLVVTTFGGARVELPLDRPPAASVQVLLSIYQVDGEFVLRAEMEQFQGAAIRPAVDAYDFYRITWLDSRTPLT